MKPNTYKIPICIMLMIFALQLVYFGIYSAVFSKEMRSLTASAISQEIKLGNKIQDLKDKNLSYESFAMEHSALKKEIKIILSLEHFQNTLGYLYLFIMFPITAVPYAIFVYHHEPAFLVSLADWWGSAFPSFSENPTFLNYVRNAIVTSLGWLVVSYVVVFVILVLKARKSNGGANAEHP